MKRLIAILLAFCAVVPLSAATFSWTNSDPLVVGYRVQMDGSNGEWVYLDKGSQSYAAQGDVLVLQYTYDGQSYSPSLVFSAQSGISSNGPIEMQVQEDPGDGRTPSGFRLNFAGGTHHTVTDGEHALSSSKSFLELGIEAQWNDLWKNAGLVLGASYTPFMVDDKCYPSWYLDALMSFRFPSTHYEVSLAVGGFGMWLNEDLDDPMYGIEGLLRYACMLTPHWSVGFGLTCRYYLKSRHYQLEGDTLSHEGNGGAITLGTRAVIGYEF